MGYMLGSTCSPCCGAACDNCADSSPTKLVVTVTNPDGDGEIAASGGGLENAWEAVETNCRPPPSSIGVGYINIVNAGSGYTAAPTPTVTGGDPTTPAVLECELRRPIASVTVSNGGSGYTSIPAVSFPNGLLHRAASATAVVRGTITSITRLATGSGYLAAPRVTVDGGTGLVAAANMTTGSLHSFTVTDGGSGYTTAGAPTVTLTAGGGSGAAATAAIGGEKVASITVANGGAGYTTPPRVVFTGGGGGGAAGTAIIENGTVVSITVNEGGSGYTSTPTVSFQVGGGPGNAFAFATVQGGQVVSITIANAGSGFLSPPVVTLSGGVGSGAKATAAIRFRVNSVTVTSGGTGYAIGTPVTFTGGGGSGATASISVSGSVTEVTVNNGGLYSNIRRTDGSEPWPWPTVRFTGGGGSGAAATINASPGGIYDITIFSGGSGYTTAPTITFSGGGGTGAEAVTALTWAASQSITKKLDNCVVVVSGYGVCSDTESEQYPPAPCLGCGGQVLTSDSEPSSDVRYGEFYRWQAIATTKTDGGSISSALQLASDDGLFIGEAIFVYLLQEWSVPQHAQEIETAWLKRFFTRVAPDCECQLIDQTESATNAILTPQFSQKEDLLRQPYWVVESVTLESGGSNLLLFGTQKQVEERPGNNLAAPGVGFTVSFTAVYSAPVVNSFSIQRLGVNTAFSVLPVFAFTFSPTGFVDGDYALTGITVTSGGTTAASNATYSLAIQSLSIGYVAGPSSGMPVINLTVAGGTVVSATIANGGKLRGGGSLASAQVDSPGTASATGRSNFQTTVTYSQPAVTASAPGGNGDAEFEVTLTEEEGANGDPFWVVTGVTVVNGGSGYTDAVGLDFTPSSPHGVESLPAVVVANRVPREEPTLTIEGDGTFNITYAAVGDAWEIAGIEVVDGGTSYENGQYLTLTLGNDDSPNRVALVQAFTATESGEIETLVVEDAGAYYKQRTALGSVTITSGGRYYNRVITETSEPLPVVNCLGAVSEANGWEKVTYKPRTEITPIAVGAAFEADTQVNCWTGTSNVIELNRTRRCDVPEVTFTIEQ